MGRVNGGFKGERKWNEEKYFPLIAFRVIREWTRLKERGEIKGKKRKEKKNSKRKNEKKKRDKKERSEA